MRNARIGTETRHRSNRFCMKRKCRSMEEGKSNYRVESVRFCSCCERELEGFAERSRRREMRVTERECVSEWVKWVLLYFNFNFCVNFCNFNELKLGEICFCVLYFLQILQSWLSGAGFWLSNYAFVPIDSWFLCLVGPCPMCIIGISLFWYVKTMIRWLLTMVKKTFTWVTKLVVK